MVVGILVVTWVTWFQCAFNLCIILGMIGTPGSAKTAAFEFDGIWYFSFHDNRYNRFAKTTASRLMVVGSRWIGAWIVFLGWYNSHPIVLLINWHALVLTTYLCWIIGYISFMTICIGSWNVISCSLGYITSSRLWTRCFDSTATYEIVLQEIIVLIFWWWFPIFGETLVLDTSR